MINWIKKLFKKQKPLKLEDIAFGKMSKGDLKKLVEEGKIKSIYPPYY